MEIDASTPTDRRIPSTLLITVTEEGQAGEARRLAGGWAREAGCDEDFAGRIALVATELAKNLALHTREGGSILVRKLGHESDCGVSILSLDRGPGVDNFGKCLRDGFSTAGTAGIGLGVVQRASQIMEVHSQPGVGTAVLSMLWDGKRMPAPGPLTTGAVSVPIKGERVCGDACAEQHGSGWSRFVVADGLGHGPLAAEASQSACDIFLKHPQRPLPELLRHMHESLRSTRGAAVAVAHVDLGKAELSYCGVGNISGFIQTTDARGVSLVSHNGTVGGVFPNDPRPFTYPWAPGNTLVLNSDGLKSNWQLARYPGLLGRHPELIGGVLYRDFVRGSDDTTVLVARSRK